MGSVLKHAVDYLGMLDPGCFVEIGTSREGDDCSTKLLSEWARAYSKDGRLITVDMDPNHCDLVRSWDLGNVTVINDIGEDYLVKHHAPISLLYLDNFDWDWHPLNPEHFVLEQRDRYAALGLDMNNVNSQKAHLRQAIAAGPKLTDACLVICDDTWFNRGWGHYSGKSGAVIPFLLSQGFEVLYTEEKPVYGTIMGRSLHN